MESSLARNYSQPKTITLVTEERANIIAQELLKLKGVSQVYLGKDHTDILLICSEDGFKPFLNLVKVYAVQNPNFIHDYEKVLFIAAKEVFRRAGKDLASVFDYLEETSGINNLRDKITIYLLPLNWKLREKEIQSEFPFILENFMLENINKAILVGNKFSG